MVMISIKKLAEELQINKDYALRLVKKMVPELDLKLHYGRRNALSLSREDADRVINVYRRGAVSRTASQNGAARPFGCGYFYIIQLHPEDLPTRLKIGYTDNLDVRQSDHRTSAPTLQLIRSWPCRRTWEEAAKASITREDCRCIGGEVFDGDVQGFLERAEAFFAIMPMPSISPGCSC